MDDAQALNTQRVALDGDLDYATEMATRALLAEAIATDARIVIADGSQVRFIDSSGLRALIGARRDLQRDGRDFRVESPSAIMRRALDVTGLTDLLDVR